MDYLYVIQCQRTRERKAPLLHAIYLGIHSSVARGEKGGRSELDGGFFVGAAILTVALEINGSDERNLFMSNFPG